jgi:hypothetical protein
VKIALRGDELGIPKRPFVDFRRHLRMPIALRRNFSELILVACGRSRFTKRSIFHPHLDLIRTGAGKRQPCSTVTSPVPRPADMSDLQKSFARAHLSRLSPEPPTVLNEEDEDGVADLRPVSPNDSSSSASSTSSTGTIVPSPSRNLFEKPRRQVCSPLSHYAL